MTESRPAIIMPASPRASKEVRVRELSVMQVSKTDDDSTCQIIKQCFVRLHRAVKAVAGVSEARNDVAVLVQALVERAQDDGHIAAFCRLLERLETLRGREQADGRHIDGVTCEQEL